MSIIMQNLLIILTCLRFLGRAVILTCLPKKIRAKQRLREISWLETLLVAVL
jgi:hypothetical protein